MEKLFVSYEVAAKLQKKGFDDGCLGYYWNWDSHNYEGGELGNIQLYIKEEIAYFYTNTSKSYNKPTTAWMLGLEEGKTFHCVAPLYQQVIDWFFEKHEISIEVSFINMPGINYFGWDYNIVHTTKKRPVDADFGTVCGTFKGKKEALDKAIEEALKII